MATKTTICKMCGSDNTTNYFSIPKDKWVFECEECQYWELLTKTKLDLQKLINNFLIGEFPFIKTERRIRISKELTRMIKNGICKNK